MSGEEAQKAGGFGVKIPEIKVEAYKEKRRSIVDFTTRKPRVRIAEALDPAQPTSAFSECNLKSSPRISNELLVVCWVGERGRNDRGFSVCPLVVSTENTHLLSVPSTQLRRRFDFGRASIWPL